MTYYDTEAARYDATRGGAPRADAAARAIESLLPADVRIVLDVAGGTGIVGGRLSRTVFSVDRSAAMSALAARRLPGRVVLGDARRLPFADGVADAVTAVWVLHLMTEASVRLVVAEAARVLRPGGLLVATVDKSAAQYRTPDDVGALLGGFVPRRPDSVATLTSMGLEPVGRTTFVGVGQGRSPRQWLDLGVPTAVTAGLAALPGQERRRSDPVYDVVAFSVEGVGRDDLLAQRHE